MKIMNNPNPESVSCSYFIKNDFECFVIIHKIIKQIVNSSCDTNPLILKLNSSSFFEEIRQHYLILLGSSLGHLVVKIYKLFLRIIMPFFIMSSFEKVL